MELNKRLPATVLLFISLLYISEIVATITKRDIETITIYITMAIAIALAIILAQRKREHRYCIRIKTSRTAPFSVLIKDLDYLSRLLATLSKEHGRASITAPLGGGANLCTSYSEIKDLIKVIDRNTSTLLIEIDDETSQ